MRSYYMKQLKAEATRISGAGTDQNFKSDWKYFGPLSFLRESCVGCLNAERISSIEVRWPC